ncbi:MAG: hypothetical protein LBT84_05975 [Spirochaetia bacterium]|jgi:hypothetical protein|nr:hypothetical protein [Spirochaetia bacterium]
MKKNKNIKQKSIKQKARKMVLSPMLATAMAFAPAATTLSCFDDNNPTGTTQEQEVTKTAVLNLDGIDITVEYKALPSDADPAYLALIQDNLDYITNSTSGSYVVLKNDMHAGSYNYKIIVEYDNIDGFKGQPLSGTVTVSEDYLSNPLNVSFAANLRTTFTTSLTLLRSKQLQLAAAIKTARQRS